MSTDDARRPLRADARRNRAAVLEAAERIFATRGVSASTEEVAREAGVGVGTLFRHFPTKEALLEAVHRSRLDRLAGEAQRLATSDDPGGAFFTYFRSIVAESGPKSALADALAEAGIVVRGAAIGEGLKALLVRAQAAGAVRTDIGLPDLVALLIGASRAVERAGDGKVRERVVAVILDGLRPP